LVVTYSRAGSCKCGSLVGCLVDIAMCYCMEYFSIESLLFAKKAGSLELSMHAVAVLLRAALRWFSRIVPSVFAIGDTLAVLLRAALRWFSRIVPSVFAIGEHLA
jgi:Na+/citrate or Na+/malate symporter